MSARYKIIYLIITQYLLLVFIESPLLIEKALDMLSNTICIKSSLRQGTFISNLVGKPFKFHFFLGCVEFWKLASTSVPVLGCQHSDSFASVNINTKYEEFKAFDDI